MTPEEQLREIIDVAFPEPLGADLYEYMLRTAPPPPRGYGKGAAAPEYSDSTSGRLAQLTRLRGLLWHIARGRMR